MIYNDADITCYARMHDKMYFIGHPAVMSEILYADGMFDLRLILTPEDLERPLACAKEAGLV